MTAPEIINPLLQETVKHVERILGKELDTVTVVRAVVGLFFTGVKLSNGSGGLSFTPLKEIPEAVCCPSSLQAMPYSGKLAKRGVREYLADLVSPAPMKKTLAIAALNALSDACLKKSPPTAYEVKSGVDAFDEAILPQGGKTVVIGALVPMLRRLLKEKADFTVLEQDASTLKSAEMEHYAPAEDAPRHVPQADLLVITGVTILNDTLPDILSMAKPGAEIIVTGPTAGMLPDAFFSRGVTLLGGISVTAPDELLDVLSEGGSGYHFFGKYAERTVCIKRR